MPNSKIIYKIRHKITGQWKFQGMSTNFSINFWSTGEWEEVSAVKAVLTRITAYNEYYATKNNSSHCQEALADMDNWEIVSYNISAEEEGTIDPKLL